MKINSRRRRDKFLGTKGSNSKISVKHSLFVDALQRFTNMEEDLDYALEDINGLGRRLRKTYFINLKNYKGAVRAFLQLMIKQGYGIEERRFVDQFGRRRIYLLIAKIDARIEELTSLILNKQASNLELASKLDEIRGLLLDIKS